LSWQKEFYTYKLSINYSAKISLFLQTIHILHTETLAAFLVPGQMYIQHIFDHVPSLDTRTLYRILVETPFGNRDYNIKMDLKETSCKLAQYPVISGVKSSGSFTRALISYAKTSICYQTGLYLI
jgi:hypothetical protein